MIAVLFIKICYYWLFLYNFRGTQFFWTKTMSMDTVFATAKNCVPRHGFCPKNFSPQHRFCAFLVHFLGDLRGGGLLTSGLPFHLKRFIRRLHAVLSPMHVRSACSATQRRSKHFHRSLHIWSFRRSAGSAAQGTHCTS